jgi:hypothetical protein
MSTREHLSGFLEDLCRAEEETNRVAISSAKLADAAHLAKREAEQKIRDDFHEQYGAFWKCRSCGAYLLSRHPLDTKPPGIVCHKCGCGGPDWNMAHGYSKQS